MTQTQAYSKESREFFFDTKLMNYYVNDSFDKEGYIKELKEILLNEQIPLIEKRGIFSKDVTMIVRVNYLKVSALSSRGQMIKKEVDAFLKEHPLLTIEVRTELEKVVAGLRNVVVAMENSHIKFLDKVGCEKVLDMEVSFSLETHFGEDICAIWVSEPRNDISLLMFKETFKELLEEGLIKKNEGSLLRYVPDRDGINKKKIKGMMNKEFSTGNENL